MMKYERTSDGQNFGTLSAVYLRSELRPLKVQQRVPGLRAAPPDRDRRCHVPETSGCRFRLAIMIMILRTMAVCQWDCTVPASGSLSGRAPGHCQC